MDEYMPWPHKKIGALVIEEIPTNQNCRVYHLRVPLYEAGISQICKWDRNAQSFETLYHEPGLFSLIAEKCPGVAGLFSPRCYELYVSKGHAFEWEEIEPMLHEILNAFGSSGR